MTESSPSPSSPLTQRAKDEQARRYNPQPSNYDMTLDPRCLWGWGPPSPGCRCYFGHACFRALGHPGKCSDGPSDLGCSKAQRPKDWDAKGRLEANA